MEFPALTNSVFHFWKTIQKFSEIDIQPNTLVLCDIDDTLLHHPVINNSWVHLISTFFYIKHNNPIESQKQTEEYYNEIVNAIPFQHTDREGFFNMVEKSTEFAFVTARNVVAKEFTYSNLRSIDVDPEIHKVHFCGNIAKGEYILRNFDLAKYDHVVFIDDQIGNLENVLSLLDHPGLKLYCFKRDKTNQPADYYPLPLGFNPEFRFDGENLVYIREGEYQDTTQDSDSDTNYENEF
jgi:hypothetical protein